MLTIDKLIARALPAAVVVAIVAGAVLAVPAAIAGEQPAEEKAACYLKKLPPLIERDVFFGDPKISGTQISPDGEWISFRKQYRDIMNIWVKGFDEPFEAARPLTADTERPVRGYFWTEDSRYVLYVQDKGGDEDFHVYAVDPRADAEDDTGVPPGRDLTPMDGVRALIYAVPEGTPNQILIGLNDRDAAMHDVYRLNIDTGERELMVTNEENVAGWIADLEGNVRLAYRQTSDGGSEILKVADGALGEAIYTCSYDETCTPYRFHKNGKQIYIQSNKGMGIDLTRLMLMCAESGKTELVESDPDSDVDFGGAMFSDATEELIGTVYVGDRVRIYPRTEQLKKDLEVLRAKLPDGELSVSSTTEDMNRMVVGVGRDVNPGSVYLYDRARGSVEKLYDSRPELPTEHLAHMKPIRYPARDGAKIPGYLTLPNGAEGHKVPTIIVPHGGPWARDYWGFDSFTQFLANRGYAVLQPNFRGSTGYGKAFLNSGNGEWGTGRMQHDLSDAVAYLIGHEIADADQIAILGGSYGGYATLAGLAFTPDLYAAGVSIVGPSNIITLLDSIPAGDPSDPEDKARLEAQSPLFSATEMKAPLLVIQGANDPRVKQAESDQIVVALRELDRTVEYMVAPDEGHGFAGEENRLAMFAVIEKFLAKHLGGRYQEGAAPEIEQRIAELMVDISTVELPEAVEGADEARTAALPVPTPGALEPMKMQHATELKLGGGQEMTIESTVELTRADVDGRSVWTVTSIANTPMGEAKDTWTLQADTLVPVSRSVLQGPVAIELAFGDESVKGMITMGAQEMPVEVALEAPVFGDQQALDAVLCALPLAEGYATPIRTFDIQSQRVRVWRLEVQGMETVDVPAGTFEAFSVAMTPLDGEGGGGTLWVSKKAPRMVVRGELAMPAQAGGGTSTAELTSWELVE